MLKEFKEKIKEKVNYEENEAKIKKGAKVVGGVVVAGTLLVIGMALGKHKNNDDCELDSLEENDEYDQDDLYLCSEDSDEDEDEVEEVLEESEEE